MSQENGVNPEWLRRLQAMKRIRKAADLIKDYGEPHHKVQQGDMEIWHYPLGVTAGVLYSIHVAVAGEDAPRTYMHMEPTTLPDTAPPRRPWWRFW